MPLLIRWWINGKWATEVHSDALEQLTAACIFAGALIVASLF